MSPLSSNGGKDTKKYAFGLLVLAGLIGAASVVAQIASETAPPLGLPLPPIPADNPQSAAKVALGDKLFHDAHFSSTGQVSCATCHVAKKAFTDSPLSVSAGIKKLTGTRHAPTVVNATPKPTPSSSSSWAGWSRRAT